MEHTDDDIFLLIASNLAQVTEGGERTQFFFDDEPLESILYGKPTNGPTQANLFLPVREQIDAIVKAYKAGNIEETTRLSAALGYSSSDISIGMCHEIASIMKNIIPDYTNAIITFDLSSLRTLLEKIWRQSLSVKNRELQKSVGNPMYRWYEHHKKYHDARMVLKKLIRIFREEKRRSSEGILINNFAFEYWLEGNPKDAMPWFRKAESIFKKIKDTFNKANTRVNYLMCKFALDELEDTEEIENELKEITTVLSSSGLWHERKAWMLLAKIEERRGNIDEAIALVKKAIESAKNSNSRYPEEDKEYLRQLQTT